MNRTSLCACVALLVVACSSTSSNDTTGAADTGGIPCDVEKVLASNCRTCHGAPPQFGAPMSLVTYADLVAPAKSDPTKKVYELVAQRIQNDASPMPPSPNAPLATSDRGPLESWASAGAPSSDTTCPAPVGADGGATPPPPGVVTPLSCTPDVTMKPASPWAMPETTDDVYVCYGFD
ncbi:MAG TPA: peptidylglycine alpha-amidating monooxygenase, partial [Labilithrix sp.]